MGRLRESDWIFLGWLAVIIIILLSAVTTVHCQGGPYGPWGIPKYMQENMGTIANCSVDQVLQGDPASCVTVDTPPPHFCPQAIFYFTQRYVAAAVVMDMEDPDACAVQKFEKLIHVDDETDVWVPITEEEFMQATCMELKDEEGNMLYPRPEWEHCNE